MAIRNIRQDNDPILKKQSREVTKFDDRLKILVEDMIDTMNYSEGVGLAAPQVGILRRVAVVDIGEDESEPIVMINPIIRSEDGSEVKFEACLSVKDMQGEVERPTSIKVEYQNIDGKEETIEATDFLARAICHEIDHLNGILYTDIAKTLYTIEEEAEEDV